MSAPSEDRENAEKDRDVGRVLRVFALPSQILRAVLACFFFLIVN